MLCHYDTLPCLFGILSLDQFLLLTFHDRSVVTHLHKASMLLRQYSLALMDPNENVVRGSNFQDGEFNRSSRTPRLCPFSMASQTSTFFPGVGTMQPSHAN